MEEEIKLLKLTLGQKFTLLRQQWGKTEEEVAAAVKKPVGTYRKMEGDFVYPSASMIKKVAKVYGMGYEELLAFGE